MQHCVSTINDENVPKLANPKFFLLAGESSRSIWIVSHVCKENIKYSHYVCLRVSQFRYEGQWESVNVTFCSRSAITRTPHCSHTRCHWFCIWNGSHFLKNHRKGTTCVSWALEVWVLSRLYAKYMLTIIPLRASTLNNWLAHAFSFLVDDDSDSMMSSL